MADILSKEKRSAIMSAIRSTHNKSTELVMVRALKAARVTGWRRHAALPGKPDFVWRKKKLALFIDGCFWHGCKKCYKPPKTNKKYWSHKIQTNMARDKRVAKELRQRKWSVLRVKECQLANERSLALALLKIARILSGA